MVMIINLFTNVCACSLPFADEVSVLSAEVTSEGDTSDSKHVLHYLPLITSVVGQGH